jgi:DNA-binding CsgD family transcriptional regulator
MIPGMVKISIRIGLVTAGLILLHELTNLLLAYHYLKYEYYLTGAVIVALITGIILTNRYHRQKTTESPDHDLLETLTAKELRVLELIATGKSNKEIASLNYTEISTVKTHINNIFSKLGVRNRKAAANLYLERTEKQKSTFSPPAGI